jgi:hypothetical protein
MGTNDEQDVRALYETGCRVPQDGDTSAWFDARRMQCYTSLKAARIQSLVSRSLTGVFLRAGGTVSAEGSVCGVILLVHSPEVIEEVRS